MYLALQDDEFIDTPLGNGVKFTSRKFLETFLHKDVLAKKIKSVADHQDRIVDAIISGIAVYNSQGGFCVCG